MFVLNKLNLTFKLKSLGDNWTIRIVTKQLRVCTIAHILCYITFSFSNRVIIDAPT